MKGTCIGGGSGMLPLVWASWSTGACGRAMAPETGAALYCSLICSFKLSLIILSGLMLGPVWDEPVSNYGNST